jgi:hypothetical protein
MVGSHSFSSPVGSETIVLLLTEKDQKARVGRVAIRLDVDRRLTPLAMIILKTSILSLSTFRIININPRLKL